MGDDDNQPMSGAEIVRWREQQEEQAKRRAMLRAWKHLLLWIGAGFIAVKAAVDVVREIWAWLLGR